MKRYGLLFSLLLLFLPVHAAKNQAVIFIDSSKVNQQALIGEINQMLFYSPTLRAKISINVFDINPDGPEFIGEIKYIHDRTGRAVAQYRPGPLPFLICQMGKKASSRGSLNTKEQLCMCTNHC